MLIYWGYVEPEQYYILYPFEEVTVSCSNGETATTNTADLYVEFTVEESGSYTITATTESGIISGDYGTRVLPNDASNYREPDVVVGSSGTSYDVVESNRATAGFTKTENETTTTMTLSEMAKTMVNEYETMITSIKKYGGFYIGRYELTANGEKPGATLTESSWYTLYGKCKELEASEKVQTIYMI